MRGAGPPSPRPLAGVLGPFMSGARVVCEVLPSRTTALCVASCGTEVFHGSWMTFYRKNF
jgi:hypothetical protein